MHLTANNGQSSVNTSLAADAAIQPPSPNTDAAVAPVVFDNFTSENEIQPSGEPHGVDIHSEADADDDNATVSTRTDDEIVNMAMTAVLPSDDDDEMEQVVYPKQTISPPAV